MSAFGWHVSQKPGIHKRKRKDIMYHEGLLKPAVDSPPTTGSHISFQPSPSGRPQLSTTAIPISASAQSDHNSEAGSAQSVSDCNLLKRPKKCNTCRTHPRRQSCKGYPICELCDTCHNSHTLAFEWMDHIFLDWSRWLADLESISMYHTTSFTSDLGLARLKNMVLDFGFEDRLEEPVSTPRSVTLWPHLQHGKSRHQYRLRGERAPAINLRQLNKVILTDVWGPELSNADIVSLLPHEAVFRTDVLLFTGYLSLLQNLPDTLIEAIDVSDKESKRSIAIELIYALVWQLQLTYSQILQVCQRFRDSSEPVVRPAIFFYCLEVMCCLLRSMSNTNWKLTQSTDSSMLLKLEEDLNTSIKRIITCIFPIECYLSGKCTGNRQPPHVPAILQFSRDFQHSRNFPKHCLIKMTQSDSDKEHPKNNQIRRPKRQRLFDALMLNDQVSCVPEHITYVDETNHLMSRRTSSTGVRRRSEQPRLRRSKTEKKRAAPAPSVATDTVSNGQRAVV